MLFRSQTQLANADAEKVLRPAIEVVIGRTYEQAGSVEWELKDKQDRGEYLEMTGTLQNKTHNEEINVSWLYPKNWNGRVVIWLDDKGKSGLQNDDVKKLVAYSSVAHLGYVMLGLFGATPSGMQGAVLQMVNHGISTGALFLLVGVLYDRRHTRDVAEFGGLAKVMPWYSAIFVLVTMSSIGLPGTNGFIGEFLTMLGAYLHNSWLAIFSATGVILSAAYALFLYRRMIFGVMKNPELRDIRDMNWREIGIFAPLVVLVVPVPTSPPSLVSSASPWVSGPSSPGLIWQPSTSAAPTPDSSARPTSSRPAG